MPFKSKAQMRLFAADPKLRKHFRKWLDETPNPEGLPEKISMDTDMILKVAAATLANKVAVCVSKKGPYKRTGSSLTSLERDMKRSEDKQRSKGEE